MKHNPGRFTTPKILSAIETKYKLLGKIDFIDYDHNYDKLIQKLSAIKKEKFAPNERILINHCDTDYYDEHILKHGVILYNTLSIIRDLQLPFFIILIYTNHIGIKKEVQQILDSWNHSSNERPQIIESLLTDLHYNNQVVDNDINIQDIKHAGISMMGAPRSHRFGVYNYLNKNNLLDKVHVSIRGYKK